MQPLCVASLPNISAVSKVPMKKILVVDDEVSVRKLVKATLRKQNIQVLQAVTGAEAMKVSESERPDLIVMDVVLPGRYLDGVTASRKIKRNPNTADCKILLISGVVHLQDEDVVGSGADDFLPKPFNPIMLRNKITGLLGNHPH